jgi:glycosyltransferase involved in cell wall biosynthesis
MQPPTEDPIEKRTDGQGPRLSIIVPAYQESPALSVALERIQEAGRATGLPFQIVCIDDGSTDDTWAVLTAHRSSMPELVALRLSRNFGKEAAICAGLDAAHGDACIVLDSDLQHPPELIPRMVQLWQDEGWDIVEAVKKTRGVEPRPYRWASLAFYRVISWFAGFDLRNASDFKLLDRRVVSEWRRLGEHDTFFRGLVCWLGFTRAQVAFDVPRRPDGRSRWSVWALIALAFRALSSFSALPLQIVSLFGLLMLILGLALGVQALRMWFLGTALPGFTTVILLQLVTGGVLMISLGLIGAYIARIYDEVKARPRYVVRDRIP